MNIRSLLMSGAIAGIFIALFSNLPLIYLGNCLACLWLWSGGIFGAWLYRRLQGRGSSTTLTGSQGAVFGLLSGFVGAIVGTVLGAIFGGAGLSTWLVSQSSSAEDLIGGTALSFLTAGYLSILALCFNIFIYPLFGAIGGAIGGVIFGKPAFAV